MDCAPSLEMDCAPSLETGITSFLRNCPSNSNRSPLGVLCPSCRHSGGGFSCAGTMGGMTTPWTRHDDRLVLKHPPELAARITGRSLAEVCKRRRELADLPQRTITSSGRTGYRPWTPKEDELVLTRPPSEVSRLIGRSFRAVHRRRYLLKKHTRPLPV